LKAKIYIKMTVIKYKITHKNFKIYIYIIRQYDIYLTSAKGIPCMKMDPL